MPFIQNRVAKTLKTSLQKNAEIIIRNQVKKTLKASSSPDCG
jgi:hypothetical protein